MFNLSSLATLPQEISNTWTHEDRSAILRPARGRKTLRLVKTMLFLISIQILFPTLYLQEVRAQEITDYEISDLKKQLERIEKKLVSLDKERDSLNRKIEEITNEKNELERKKPTGFLSRFTGIFRERKRRSLYTKLQDMSDRIRVLNKRREPLANELAALADELIDKSNSRMEALMEAILKHEVSARGEAKKQVSDLWQLAETTRETRSQYVPTPLGPKHAITFPPLLSDDPEEIRLGIAILKDAAAEARTEAAKLKGQIQERRRKKRLLELRVEIRRSDEETGTMGIEDGIAPIPWGATDAAVKREIDAIGKEIDELSAKMQKYTTNAERFESQIDAELERKSEDD